MKKFLSLVCCFLLMLSMFGCGKQETQETDTGAAGQPEEMADTTRLDSAAGEDTTAADTTAGIVEDSTASEETTGQ